MDGLPAGVLRLSLFKELAVGIIICVDRFSVIVVFKHIDLLAVAVGKLGLVILLRILQNIDHTCRLDLLCGSAALFHLHGDGHIGGSCLDIQYNRNQIFSVPLGLGSVQCYLDGSIIGAGRRHLGRCVPGALHIGLDHKRHLRIQVQCLVFQSDLHAVGDLHGKLEDRLRLVCTAILLLVVDGKRHGSGTFGLISHQGDFTLIVNGSSLEQIRLIIGQPIIQCLPFCEAFHLGSDLFLALGCENDLFLVQLHGSLGQ